MQIEPPGPDPRVQGIDIRRLPGFRRLALDYAYDFGRLSPFYAGNPADGRDWTSAIERTQAYPRDRKALVAALGRQQQRRGAAPEAQAALRRLADPSAVVVVTGQQAGLFGGPLYTLLKAVTALQLASRLTAQYGVPGVAVFWIDGEDHDWEEVAGVRVLDANLHLRDVQLPGPPGAGSLPVASLVLDAAAQTAVDDLAAMLPATEFTGTLLTRLRTSYSPGTRMADAFGRWLEGVLGEHGLVVYDSSDPATKPLVREVFAREVSYPGRTAELAAEAGRRLTALGYHAQVEPHLDSLALFSLGDGRVAIHFDESGFAIGSERTDLAALLEQVRRTPEGFSPNVLLRPIVQDALFPTVAYVAGPNELAYLGQLKTVYDHFGVPMPLMCPRASATLLEPAADRFVRRYGIPLDALQAQDESALNHLLEAQLPPSVERALHEATGEVEARMQALVAAVPAIDPTLEGAARSVLGRMRHDLQGLHTKIIHAAKKRDETLRRQFTRAQAQAFPGGHPQERTVGFVSFLNRYGPPLVDRLMSDLPLDLGRHWVLIV